jgi:hypothetical protein
METMTIRSMPPLNLGGFEIDLPEVMYFLYLPVMMYGDRKDIRLPPPVKVCRRMVSTAIEFCRGTGRFYRYAYLSARKGWATPDNPLNRPGWHCDGFGTEDMNFVWWTGPGTRFAVQQFQVEKNHLTSLDQFEQQIDHQSVITPEARRLYAISPSVVHATPIIAAPGCMRQYIKVSLSNERYNLEDNSKNWMFDYDWPTHPRSIIRNDPHRAQLDYVTDGQ